MITANCPRHLVMAGRGLNFAGAGRAPGSHAYVNPATGEVVEVYFGKAVSVGSTFALCAVANNPAIPAVRVDHALLNGSGPLVLGQVVMLAVAFGTGGPSAKAVWPLASKAVTKSTMVEKLGTICAVKSGYGFIRPSDGTADCFYHVSELKDVVPVVGVTVRFTPKADPRGAKAVNVRPA